MKPIEALFLGVIQGATEFIPISSTAHLTVAAAALGVIDPVHPERWTAFMATIQLGTLAAVIAYFMKDIVSMTRAFVRENIGSSRKPLAEQSEAARLSWLVIIGSIPIVVIGLVLKDFIEGAFTKDLDVIAASMIGVALLLALADRRATFTRTTKDMTITDAVTIGAAQALALIPGSSRSGTTIMAGLFRGLTREDAARFSFLLSLPAILGAGVLQFAKEVRHITWDDGGLQLVIATVAAAISGYWSIAFLLGYLRKKSLMIFIVYRLCFGVAILVTSCAQPQDDPKAIINKPMEQPAASAPGTDSVDEIADRTDTASITHFATIRTSKGTIVLGLYGDDAPKTVANFVALARSKYYDGVLIHRVSKGFIVQAGDPTTRSSQNRQEWGKGGTTADGKPLPEELDPALPSARIGYAKGVVAMARKQASGTGTSQFFICLEKAVQLPYQYTIFGRVLEGIEFVDDIASVDIEPGPLGETDGVPKQPIVISSVRISSAPAVSPR